MPVGLMDLLLQETPHWAENVNVLVGNTDAERHRARALRVYPGRLNMAWFVVGAGGAPDAYSFRLQDLLRVPKKCEAATVAVQVAQKSTQRKAVVEFSLDPLAGGRGCYSV